MESETVKASQLVHWRAHRWIWWLFYGLPVVPALVALRIQLKHWVNIPIWDEWDTPGIALLHYFQGALTWEDLFAQHNESRKVIPRLIHIAIASVAGWDVRQGMVLTFLCVCAVSISTLVYLRWRNAAAPVQILFAWALINLLLFAPSQYENFLSGFAFEIFIPFLCLFACCGINLSSWPLSRKVACNSALALFSSYTFAHGMLLWVFAIPIPTQPVRAGVRGVRGLLLPYGIYLAAAIISIAYYFVGYKRPEISPPTPTLRQLPDVLEFVVVWLGSVLRSPFVSPRFAGTLVSILIAATVACTFVTLKANKDRWANYYPWLLLLGFALASGAMTAVGRVNLGIDLVFNLWFIGFQSMRYNATAVFSYVALMGLVFNIYQDAIRFRPVLRGRFLTGLTISCTLLAVAWTELFANEWIRVKEFQANRRRARTAVIWINALPENPEIFLAYPYPSGFWQRVEEMRKAGLLKLPKVSDAIRQAIASPPSATDSSAGHLDLSESRPAGHVRFAGWGRNPVTGNRAEYVVLGWQDGDNSFYPFTAIRTGIVRPDVATAYGSLSLKTGFDQEIEVSTLPQQAVTIKAWAIDWDGERAFPLAGEFHLKRPGS